MLLNLPLRFRSGWAMESGKVSASFSSYISDVSVQNVRALQSHAYSWRHYPLHQRVGVPVPLLVSWLMRQFSYSSQPGVTSRPYVLQTTFPNRDLTDEKQTIKDAKLQNSVVTMRYT